MPSYVRVREGNTYFFTVVTHKRQPILCDDVCTSALRKSIEKVRRAHPFDIKAWVLLPDHLHCIWELPADDKDYSKRWGMIKKDFTERVKDRLEFEEPSASRIKHREHAMWQRRFWEHSIRDEEDFKNHCDYIHYNPVKHGLVKNVKDWEYSTFHRYVKNGYYEESWGGGDVKTLEKIDCE